MTLDARREILKSLRAIPVIVRSLASGIPESKLRERPTVGDWAIVEVIAHMADTDETAFERVRRMVAEDEPNLAAFDPEALAAERVYISMDVERTINRFDLGRRAHVSFLEDLQPTRWHRTGRHSEHGRLTLELYESHVASEDVDHLAQIARILLGGIK
jgi:hypothetical protein